MSAYRDPLTHLREVVRAKAEAVAAAEAALSPAMRVRLPAAVRRRLRQLADEDLTATNELEALSAAQADLDALLTVLDRARSRQADSAPTAVASVASDQGALLIEEDDQRSFRSALEAALARVDESARLERRGDLGYVTRFSVQGAPVVLTATLTVKQVAWDSTGRAIAGYALELRAGVASDLPALVVRPESAVAALGSILGIVEDLDMRDEPFDEAFLVQGDADVARLVLTPAVRRAFVRLAPLAPELRVEASGIVTLRWRNGEALEWVLECLPRDALAVVVAVRDAVAV